jgi:1-acyl-sn-glycerol-3-phosphate acyltransferase
MAGFAATSAFGTALCATLNVLRISPLPVCRWYFATATRVMGIRVIVRGEQSAAKSKLAVANHISYLDIFVLGGLIKGSFVAKAEIANWPVFGTMGKVGHTVFVDRKRTATGVARDGIQERLDAGHTLIMFPESTSHDGNRVRPFKSALFTVAERRTRDGQPVTVQPVSIAYTRLNGLPLGIGWRSFFAWYGDMDLMPHVWQAMRLGRLTAEVTFHPPVTIDEFRNRKDLAAYCTQVAGDGMARLLSGRHAA